MSCPAPPPFRAIAAGGHPCPPPPPHSGTPRHATPRVWAPKASSSCRGLGGGAPKGGGALLKPDQGREWPGWNGAASAAGFSEAYSQGSGRRSHPGRSALAKCQGGNVVCAPGLLVKSISQPCPLACSQVIGDPSAVIWLNMAGSFLSRGFGFPGCRNGLGSTRNP